VTAETRAAGKRVRVWSSGTYAWHTSRRAREPAAPIPTGDPFKAFRRAYRAGTLRDLGDGRFEVPFKHVPRGWVIYDVDPATGQPLRLTVRSGNAAKTVVRLKVYERLPVTATNRRLLDELPHPGPGSEPASKYFAVLRTSATPSDPLPRIPLAGDTKQFGLNPDGARQLAKNVWLVPGKGFVCLVTENENGTGMGCNPLRSASKRGISSGNPSHLLLVVPDGVKSVRARKDAQHDWKTYPISGTGLVRLPALGYRVRLLR
jgi:hypothetical protein